jgi:predicted extracellular nuclease
MKRQGTILLIAMLLAMLVNMAPAPAQADAPTELFFSEYIEGSSYNKALEIYNGTGAAVDLAAGGYNIFMSFNGGTSTYTINLTGSVADGDVYVVGPTNATDPTILAADQLQGTSWFNGDDAVVLRKGTIVLDAIGQIGFDPGTEWGAGDASTADNTLRRKADICAGDPDGDNIFDPALEWDGFAQNTFDGLGAHTANCTPSIQEPKINEFSASTTGTDVEYVEIFGEPVTDYSAYTMLEIEGDFYLAATGMVDEVIPLGTTDANGLYLANLAANALENGSITLLLVKDFTGALGNDLDTNEDGAFDATPWSAIVDAVAVNDGGASDLTYGSPVLGVSYDGLAYAPGGASRIPDGLDTDTATDWVRNDFDLAGIPGFDGTILLGEAYNTPGAPNQIYTPPAVKDPVINEFSASTTGTDVEYVEIYGDPNTDYSAYTILEIEGDFYLAATGTVDEVISLGTTDADGLYLANLAANALENGSITLLLVKDFTGALGNDLDTNEDGVLDVTPWSAIVDAVAVNDGGASDRTYGFPVLTAYYDGLAYAPGGASRIPDGYDTGAVSDWVRNDFDLAGIPGYVGTIVLGEAYNTPGAPNMIYTPPPEDCGDPYTPIYAIQGSGDTSPLVGTEVALEGVVVGDFQRNASPDSGDLNGFFVQDVTGDGDPLTSDAIFIYGSGADDFAIGDSVRVRGNVSEYNGLTEVSVIKTWGCSTGNLVPSAIELTLPFASTDFLERYEGMLVKVPQTLVISEYYNYDRYGEMVLGLPLDGENRLFTPTSVVEPGLDAIALASQNSLRRITLDDGMSSQNPSVLRHPNGSPFSLTNLFRGGDWVQNAEGILDQFSPAYRIQPTQGADYYQVNPRPIASDPVGGNLKIAAMNTLNYFLTLDYPTGNPLDNKCGPLQNQECRGADYDQPEEFSRQKAKLLAALSGLDAAVIGLNELENTTGVEPLADIVAGLNDFFGAGTYAYIDTGTIGTDAIKVGLIYRPAMISPVGNYAILDSAVDEQFLDDYNRPTLAQAFEENSSGERFTVAVNHLKSKGSACDDVGDFDLGDGQGNCNVTRTLAAQALVDWLASDPTGSGDPDFIIMGDLNSYAMEDPIDAIKAGPDDIPGTADDYTNLIFDYQGLYAYSYVFDGQNGYLDHALANLNMAGQITGATEWHINADEPDVLDYDTSYKPDSQDALYEPNAYRSSDHDAVIVGLNLSPSQQFITGGGWIEVPEGKGEFSFDAKYVKEYPYPVGAVSYVISKADLYFTSTSFDWLVLGGNTAWLQGTGSFYGNEDEAYDFLLTAIDYPDSFRIQIWDVFGILVYDSQPGTAKFLPPITTINKGNITFH